MDPQNQANIIAQLLRSVAPQPKSPDAKAPTTTDLFVVALFTLLLGLFFGLLIGLAVERSSQAGAYNAGFTQAQQQAATTIAQLELRLQLAASQADNTAKDWQMAQVQQRLTTAEYHLAEVRRELDSLYSYVPAPSYIEPSTYYVEAYVVPNQGATVYIYNTNPNTLGGR